MLNIQKINTCFRKAAEIIPRLRWLNIILFLLVMVVSAAGLRLVKTDVSQDNWFLEGDAMLAVKERFEELFGNDDFCAVLVEADNVFTPEILSGIRSLGKELVEKVPYSDDVISITDFEFTLGSNEGIEIIDLVPDAIPTSRHELDRIKEMALSKPYLKNRLISDDGRQAWVMLRMKNIADNWKKDGLENPEMAIGRIFNEVVAQDKYKALHPKTTGLPVTNVDKRNFFSQEMPRMIGLSLVMMIILLAIFLRNVRGVIFPLLTSVGSIMIVFGAQGFLGIRNDPSMIFLPVFLSMAVSIAYSVHVINFFNREFLRTGQRRQAIIDTIEETGWPIFFCAMTTSAGLISMLFVPLKPIRWAGLTASSLVMVTMVMVVVLLPSLLSFGKNREPHPVYARKGGRLLERFMDFLSQKILSRQKVSLAVFAISVIFCLFGLMRFEVSFDTRRTFGLDIPYVNRIHYISRTKVGSLHSYGVALEFHTPDAAKEPGNLSKFEQMIHEIEMLRLTKKTTSLIDIVKDMNQVLNNGDPAFHRIPESQEMIAQLLLLYENAGGREAEKWVDYDYQRLRLLVEVNDYNSEESAKELKFIQRLGKELFPDAKLLFTGVLPQYTVMMDYLTWGQIKSFLFAVGVIVAFMVIVFGSIKTGLIGMIPNIAPAIAIAGIMGYAGIPLDMITVLTIPMLLGLAVDDTIHFINQCQLGFLRTSNYRSSIRGAFISVGTAMLLSSLVLILVFSVYLSSTAKVFFHMGFLVPLGILAALITDYFITPVLLIFFKPFGEDVRETADDRDSVSEKLEGDRSSSQLPGSPGPVIRI